MSNVRTINGIPIMTYGLTGMLIAMLTYSTFAPELEPEPETTSIFASVPDIKTNSISNTFAQLSVPSFMPAAAAVAAAPIPALLAPSAELSKSVSDMLTPSLELEEPKQSSAPGLEEPNPNQSPTGEPKLNQSSAPGLEEPKPNQSPTGEPKPDENEEKEKAEEEELGLRGGKKNKTRKYKR
jgi:hypothetical protein